MSFDDHHPYPNGGVFSAVPLCADSDSGSAKSLLSNPSSHVSRKYHATSRQDSHNVRGLIFGLRSGFASHLLLGLLVVLAFSEQVSSAATDDSLVVVLLLMVAWIVATGATAVLSSKAYFWVHQPPQQTSQEHHQTVEQEFYLFHGCLIGMFFAWILFDLLLEAQLVVFAVHFGVAVAGHCYIRSARQLFLKNRRSNRVIIISDDLMKSLDLA